MTAPDRIRSQYEADLPEVIDAMRDHIAIRWLSREDAIRLLMDLEGLGEDAAAAMLDAPPRGPHAGWQPRIIPGAAE